jgi:uncharacterized membrane protein
MTKEDAMTKGDLGEYYRKEFDEMKRKGASDEEIIQRFDSMDRLQEMVVKALL